MPKTASRLQTGNRLLRKDNILWWWFALPQFFQCCTGGFAAIGENNDSKPTQNYLQPMPNGLNKYTGLRTQH
jgi:hypothetical protein